MKKRYLILFALVAMLFTLTLALTGCGQSEETFDGKNIATFYMNGGTLDYQTSSSTTKVHFAYHPGTYILAPEKIPGYKLYNIGYDFTGWYTSAECKPNEKWDFEKDTFNTPELTLYAGWKKSIKHTYTVCYVDEVSKKTVSLGEYPVSSGAKFEDLFKYASKREGYTSLGFYSDPELETPWNESFTHPGGDSDYDVPVYVKFIEGKWNIVSNYTELNSALKGNKNAYITKDIDCGGKSLTYESYSGTINGNGHTVSNFAVAKTGSLVVFCSIFEKLKDGAKICDVTFADAKYDLKGVSQTAISKTLRVAAIAQSIEGEITISNVSISGALTTNYTGELPRLNEAIYDSEATYTKENFTCTITVTVES